MSVPTYPPPYNHIPFPASYYPNMPMQYPNNGPPSYNDNNYWPSQTQQQQQPAQQQQPSQQAPIPSKGGRPKVEK